MSNAKRTGPATTVSATRQKNVRRVQIRNQTKKWWRLGNVQKGIYLKYEYIYFTFKCKYLRC